MPFNNFKEDEVLKESLNVDIITRLLKYLKPYKGRVIKTLLLIAVVIAVDLLNPYFLKLGIDKYIVNKDMEGFVTLGAWMIAANILSMFCAKLRIRTMSAVTNEILLTIRQQLYSHIQKLSFSFFDSRPVGKILARIIGDVNSLNELFSNSVTNLIPELITIVAVGAIMVSMNYKLALASLATLPFLMICMFCVQTVSRKRWQIVQKKKANLNAFTHEDFSGMRVVQSFTAEGKTSRTFRELLQDHMNAFMKAVQMNDFFWPLVEVSWGIGAVIVFLYGIRMLNTEGITIGLLVAFTGYIAMFWRPIMNISNFYNMLITNMAGAERIFEIMDIKPDIEDAANAGPIPKIKGNVVFKHVTFAYDEEQPVLKDVSFHVSAGETIALVGPTGAGKTTVVNLVSRFYDTQQGDVLIDGHNVKEVTLESLRGQMGIMPQDTFLFSGSIRENIRYGKLDATDEEIEQAARAVHAHDFIIKLPKGYDTDVNERGSRLSVGQRQLVAFARAILANPRILILDEATASIDTHTERLVQEGIKRLLKGRTSFVIAHRLSTIQSADRILVIDEGKIKETGNHEQLMDERGLYYELFMAQFKFLEGREVG